MLSLLVPTSFVPTTFVPTFLPLPILTAAPSTSHPLQHSAYGVSRPSMTKPFLRPPSAVPKVQSPHNHTQRKSNLYSHNDTPRKSNHQTPKLALHPHIPPLFSLHLNSPKTTSTTHRKKNQSSQYKPSPKIKSSNTSSSRSFRRPFTTFFAS
ncbi:hypothetical protein BC829DRAFT_125027 [Chytridium lagenaria]|nr:hypothetical protein BC829DRAFT_125027 [Chytridium lagenaria]